MLNAQKMQSHTGINEGAFRGDGQQDQIGVGLILGDELPACLNGGVGGLNGLVACLKVTANNDVEVSQIFNDFLSSAEWQYHWFSPG